MAGFVEVVDGARGVETGVETGLERVFDGAMGLLAGSVATAFDGAMGLLTGSEATIRLPAHSNFVVLLFPSHSPSNDDLS